MLMYDSADIGQGRLLASSTAELLLDRHKEQLIERFFHLSANGCCVCT